MSENPVLSFPSEVVAFGREFADHGSPAAWCFVLRSNEYEILRDVYQRLRQRKLKPDDRRRTARIAGLVMGRLYRELRYFSGGPPDEHENKRFANYTTYRSHVRVVMDFLDAVIDAHREQFGEAR
jgi:hypothetical protein